MRHETWFVSPVISADALRRRVSRPFAFDITKRVFLLGAIPIMIAVLLGVASILLLNRADAAREGALTVSSIYRQVVSAMSARDAYVEAEAGDRSRHLSMFSAAVDGASSGLNALNDATDNPEHALALLATIASLDRYEKAMGELDVATARNDRLLSEMSARLATLVALTDEARRRQQEANADVVNTLSAKDVTLRATRNVVDAAQATRSAITDDALASSAGRHPDDPAYFFEATRIENAGSRLRLSLHYLSEADQAAEFEAMLAEVLAGGSPRPALDWLDRRLKIDGTAERALHDEVMELLTYTVEANETEQATQNIAVKTLKLAEETAAAISRRNSGDIAAVIDQSRLLGDEIMALPISPLIQTEMLNALDLWREGLTATKEGLADQNAILARMSEIAGIMIRNVSDLNNALSANAERIGRMVRSILLFGAGIGLLAGAGAGLLVARSITIPLKRLEQGMLDRAADPASGPLPDAGRRDEIGSMARATNRFLAELGKREGALRNAKERTEKTLQQLKRTQSELIQAGKLASLGQLVAGVAHEINTPLGVALTTATVMGEETRQFQGEVRDGKVTREAFDGFVKRMSEGARLVSANLERSANLVHSFKQVAADQASGERRIFLMDAFVAELFTSLGPMGKRAGHRIEIDCEPGIRMNSYPGALAQVLTNLLANAYAHAFDKGTKGLVQVTIRRLAENRVRIVFADNGKGIARQNRHRIFDPFFTTGRARGSTGLGLHIVYNLVTATLGGALSVDSEPGQGARFTIELPTDCPPAHARERDGRRPDPVLPSNEGT